jgi:hypothetical protein
VTEALQWDDTVLVTVLQELDDAEEARRSGR